MIKAFSKRRTTVLSNSNEFGQQKYSSGFKRQI